MKAFVELGAVADFINGAAFKPEDWGEEGLKIIRIQNLTDKTKPFNRTKRTVDKKFHIEQGDLLVSWSATLGVYTWEDEEIGLLNQHIFRVLPNSKIDKKYLRHSLDGALNEMNRHLHGATMKHVNRGEFLATKIFLPPLPEQKRIAAILDKADELTRKREAAIAKLDQLAHSIFVEMFGDPITNPKKWPRATLGDFVFSASDGPHVSPSYVENGVPFLSTRHVRPGEVIWKDLKYISKDDANLHWKKCKPTFGDILYSKGGTTGYAAVVKTHQEFAIWVHIALLKPNFEKCNPVWLVNMLNSTYCYRQSQELTHGIANRDLGLKRMLTIAMYSPPLELQNEFVSRISQLEKLKADNTAALAKQNNLFASLQHQAFAGQL